jgi:predicted RecB family nuclease
MLEASGFAASGPGRGFVIGTDGLADLDTAGMTLTWFDLDVPAFVTFSRSQGKAKRTALQHYDFEHAIRLDIARAAARRTGSADDPEPLVQPVFTEECGTCPWHDHCLAIAGDLASASVTAGRLDVREWRALDRLGITTRDQLCGLDVEHWPLLDDYLLEVTHQSRPVERLHTAVRRARMARDGIRLVRETTGAIDVPRADVEIDFDLEDAEGRVYLWGALVTAPDGAAAYVPHVSWQPLDEQSERELAQEFVSWLREQRDAAAARGQSTLAFHYTSHELSHLRRILGADEVADVAPIFVDLYPVVSEHYFGASGLGLKQVAQHFGFAWRDEEPNGLLSQLWYLEAVGDDVVRAEAARQRLLDYNEDDVRATLVTRNGMGADPAPG